MYYMVYNILYMSQSYRSKQMIVVFHTIVQVPPYHDCIEANYKQQQRDKHWWIVSKLI